MTEGNLANYIDQIAEGGPAGYIFKDSGRRCAIEEESDIYGFSLLTADKESGCDHVSSILNDSFSADINWNNPGALTLMCRSYGIVGQTNVYSSIVLSSFLPVPAETISDDHTSRNLAEDALPVAESTANSSMLQYGASLTYGKPTTIQRLKVDLAKPHIRKARDKTTAVEEELTSIRKRYREVFESSSSSSSNADDSSEDSDRSASSCTGSHESRKGESGRHKDCDAKKKSSSNGKNCYKKMKRSQSDSDRRKSKKKKRKLKSSKNEKNAKKRKMKRG